MQPQEKNNKININLIDKQTADFAISLLERLCKRGNNLIQQMDGKPVKRLRYKNRWLMPVTVAAQSYAEGALTLLKENRTQAADVLLRSLYEMALNKDYAICASNQDNLVTLLLTDIGRAVKNIRRAKTHLTNNPNQSTAIRIEELEILLQNWEKQKRKLESRYPSASTSSDLYSRSVAVDLATKNMRRPTDWAWGYSLIYGTLSGNAHMNTPGLRAFQNRNRFRTIGEPKEIVRIVHSFFAYYGSILITYADRLEKTELSDIRAEVKKVVEELETNLEDLQVSEPGA